MMSLVSLISYKCNFLWVVPLKGRNAVPKDIKYADIEPLFPWRPK